MLNLDMIYIFVQPWDVDKHKQANKHTHTHTHTHSHEPTAGKVTEIIAMGAN